MPLIIGGVHDNKAGSPNLGSDDNMGLHILYAVLAILIVDYFSSRVHKELRVDYDYMRVDSELDSWILKYMKFDLLVDLYADNDL